MPQSTLPLRPARFVIDGLAGTYNGFTRGERWNGWAVPYFPLDEARRIADDYASEPPGVDGQNLAEYDADRDLVRLYDPSNKEWDEYGSETLEGRELYGIGACYWTWEETGPDVQSAGGLAESRAIGKI